MPDDATVKQVTLKREPTGEWFATFGVEVDREPPTKPDNPERCVGIDVGIPPCENPFGSCKARR